MTLWWAWWLAVVARRKRPAKLPVTARKPKARRVPAYRRVGDTDELRRIH